MNNLKTIKMKRIKIFFLPLLAVMALTAVNAQEPTISSEEEAVVAIMKKYKEALQNKTTEGTFELFSADSKVFEQGGIEGTYANYIEHHLGPELSHFNRFEFSDYMIQVEVGIPYAFTTETYTYTIELQAEKGASPRIIKRKGVATSILKKTDDQWKIIKTHSSSRNKK